MPLTSALSKTATRKSPHCAAKPKTPGTILLNHSIHMQPIRRGPNGPLVQMECARLPSPGSRHSLLPYADPNYVTAKVTYESKEVLLPVKSGTLQPRHAMGRAYMAPVKFPPPALHATC